MRLSQTDLQIDCSEVKDSFPDEVVFADWSCDADLQFDDIENRNFYEFNNFEVVVYFYDENNDECIWIPTDGQIAWIMTDVENAALEQLNS
jgi:hypothetical protein